MLEFLYICKDLQSSRNIIKKQRPFCNIDLLAIVCHNAEYFEQKINLPNTKPLNSSNQTTNTQRARTMLWVLIIILLAIGSIMLFIQRRVLGLFILVLGLCLIAALLRES